MERRASVQVDACPSGRKSDRVKTEDEELGEERRWRLMKQFLVMGLDALQRRTFLVIMLRI